MATGIVNRLDRRIGMKVKVSGFTEGCDLIFTRFERSVYTLRVLV